MTRRLHILRRLSAPLRDTQGNVLVEFALIGPAMIGLLLAVLQVGLQIQNYNAVRNLAADGSRFAVVQYQRGIKSTGPAIETWIRSKATGGVYNLNTDRLTVTVTPVDVSNRQIAGMNEMTIAMNYEAPEYLWTFAGDTLNISYTRAVFLPT